MQVDSWTKSNIVDHVKGFRFNSIKAIPVLKLRTAQIGELDTNSVFINFQDSNTDFILMVHDYIFVLVFISLPSYFFSLYCELCFVFFVVNVWVN